MPVVLSTRIFPSFASVATFATIVGAGVGDADALGAGVGLVVDAVPPHAPMSNAVAMVNTKGRIGYLRVGVVSLIRIATRRGCGDSRNLRKCLRSPRSPS